MMTKNKIILEIKKSAEKFGVEFEFIYKTYFYLAKGDKKILFSESMPETTNALIYRITENKLVGNNFLKNGNFPVLEMEEFKDYNQAISFLKRNDKIVVKPIHGIHGKGVTVELDNEGDLEEAILFAKKNDPRGKVLLEKFVLGNDYRILVIGKKNIFVSKREPAFVIGNGKLKIKELIDIRNNLLIDRYWAKKDRVTLEILRKSGFDFDSVPKEGEKVFLRKTANVKSGGTATDATEDISEEIKKIAIAIACFMNMDVVGIDIITEDIGGKNFSIIELNAYPGLLLHIYPTYGKPRMVADEIVKHFFN